MPIIKSAKKRVRVSNKAKARNTASKSSLRSAFKAFQSSLGVKKNTSESTAKAHSELDKAAKKGLMHKNKVARKKRQMAAAAKKAGVKPAASVATAKKPAAKKAAPAKKPAAKKSVKK